MMHGPINISYENIVSSSVRSNLFLNKTNITVTSGILGRQNGAVMLVTVTSVPSLHMAGSNHRTFLHKLQHKSLAHTLLLLKVNV
jgi:hypothetical protein